MGTRPLIRSGLVASALWANVSLYAAAKAKTSTPVM